jgi:hypothetical protein
MRQFLVAAMLSSGLWLVTGRAVAGTVLTSQPLKGGAGGLVCSCSNLTGEAVMVTFGLRHANGGSFCQSQTVSTSGFPSDCTVGSTLVRTCTVSRDDGKPVSAKQLLCTFSSLDAAGNTTAVVPVDAKLKQ